MSPKYSLSGVDMQKWGTNLGLFLAPVALIYLIAVITAINNSGVSLAVFVPDQLTIGAMVLYVLNGLVDLLRKYQGGAVVADVIPPAAPTQ
jgi:hypothetical protein